MPLWNYLQVHTKGAVSLSATLWNHLHVMCDMVGYVYIDISILKNKYSIYNNTLFYSINHITLYLH